MSTNTRSIPPRLAQIIEDFEISEGREKLELLLEYSERMPPLNETQRALRDRFEDVPECMTPVSVFAETEGGRMQFFFDIPEESPTVRGFAAILAEGLAGSTPQQVLAVPSDFYLQMGLDQVLSHQRLNGITAILAHIKRMAVNAMPPAE
jgi:cysteine desulfuration protein SufE